jgi:hypothetical protein
MPIFGKVEKRRIPLKAASMYILIKFTGLRKNSDYDFQKK